MCKLYYRDVLDDLLKERQAIIVSLTSCEYSDFAKDTLKSWGVAYTPVELNHLYGEDMMEFANCFYGTEKRRVPLIFMDNKKVGNLADLFNMKRHNKIKPWPKPETPTPETKPAEQS